MEYMRDLIELYTCEVLQNDGLFTTRQIAVCIELALDKEVG